MILFLFYRYHINQKMIRFSNCCFCFGLENGVIVIGVLSILASIAAIANVASVEHLNHAVLAVEIIIDALNVIAAVILILGVTRVNNFSPQTIFQEILLIILYFVIQRNAKLMFPWMVVDAIRIVANIALLIVVLFSENQQSNLIGQYIVLISEQKSMMFSFKT